MIRKIHITFSSLVALFMMFAIYVYCYHKYWVKNYYVDFLPKDKGWPTVDNVTGKIYNNWEVMDYVPTSNLFFYNIFDFGRDYGLAIGLLLLISCLVIFLWQFKVLNYWIGLLAFFVLFGLYGILEVID